MSVCPIPGVSDGRYRGATENDVSQGAYVRKAIGYLHPTLISRQPPGALVERSGSERVAGSGGMSRPFSVQLDLYRGVFSSIAAPPNPQ